MAAARQIVVRFTSTSTAPAAAARLASLRQRVLTVCRSVYFFQRPRRRARVRACQAALRAAVAAQRAQTLRNAPGAAGCISENAKARAYTRKRWLPTITRRRAAGPRLRHRRRRARAPRRRVLPPQGRRRAPELEGPAARARRRRPHVPRLRGAARPRSPIGPAAADAGAPRPEQPDRDGLDGVGQAAAPRRRRPAQADVAAAA